MTDSPSIINCDGVVFVTSPFPPGRMSSLKPSEQDQVEMGVDVDLRGTFDNEYFVVVISNWIRSGHADPRAEAWDEKVHKVLSHVWTEMTNRGLVEGPMPEIIKGNPLDMLPK